MRMFCCSGDCSVSFLSLPVVSRPLQLTRVSFEGQGADSASPRAEIEYRPIVLHVHNASGVRKALPAERTLERLRRRLRLPDLFRFSLSLSEHQNVIKPNRAFHVS